jgi:hypothetical protein
MKLTEAIEAARKSQGLKCKVGRLLNELPDTDAREFGDILADPHYQHSQIARGMTALGHLLREDAVMNHRRGECSCGPR